MQNYSDSEDDRSSDEEGKKKKSRRRSKEISGLNAGEDDRKLNSESDDKRENEIEFGKVESNSPVNSPELTPSLDNMKLDKLNEQEPAKQSTNYQQGNQYV